MMVKIFTKPLVTCEVYFDTIKKIKVWRGDIMGTFLKIVGIAVLIFGIIVIVFALLGMGRYFSFLSTPDISGESTPMIPWMSWSIAGNIGGAIGGFIVVIGGVALYCLGTIYNIVIDIKAH